MCITLLKLLLKGTTFTQIAWDSTVLEEAIVEKKEIRY